MSSLQIWKELRLVLLIYPQVKMASTDGRRWLSKMSAMDNINIPSQYGC